MSGLKFTLYAALAIIFFLAIFGRGFSWSGNHEGPPVRKLPAPARPLNVGATGTLFGKKYRTTGHTIVEIAEDGANWERHEYELTDDDGAKALLACGDKPDGADWLFLEQFSPMQAPTAKELAAKQIGSPVELESFTGKVGEIFLSTIEQADDAGLNDLMKNGGVTYGIRCTNESHILFARWNDTGIQFYHGQTLTAKKGIAHFTAAK